MSGYLVSIACLLDDMPCQLHADERVAIAHARGLASLVRIGAFRGILEKLAEKLEVSTSEVCGIRVVRFDNGKPVSSKWFAE
jgi:hypothetical protein